MFIVMEEHGAVFFQPKPYSTSPTNLLGDGSAHHNDAETFYDPDSSDDGSKSRAYGKLPASLFITGVTGRDTNPTLGSRFGDIYQASYIGRKVALKHVRIFRDQDADHNGKIDLEFCREALVWQHLQHPHILPLIGIDCESFPTSLCMVSPWMEHGTVLEYLDHHGRSNVDRLLSEIAQGLQYLHSNKIVHGDLRGANILINDEWSACLADFGLSNLDDAATAIDTPNLGGSTHWMAPELLSPEHFREGEYCRTPASDVYAFGCVCLELYTGRPPFLDVPLEMPALMKVINGDRPDKPSCDPPISVDTWRLMNDYWAQNPAERPTADIVAQQMGRNSVSSLTSVFPPPESRLTAQDETASIINGSFCRTLAGYDAQDPSNISFKADETLEVLTIQPSGWWYGQLRGERGWFPSTYVRGIPREAEMHGVISCMKNPSPFIRKKTLRMPSQLPHAPIPPSLLQSPHLNSPRFRHAMTVPRISDEDEEWLQDTKAVNSSKSQRENDEQASRRQPPPQTLTRGSSVPGGRPFLPTYPIRVLLESDGFQVLEALKLRAYKLTAYC
ncbi:kinase-like domain-containing protein [Mycena rebaudengoi]|nr:kinase-like domain-containing protein [Mycena rebaudengoi]